MNSELEEEQRKSWLKIILSILIVLLIIFLLIFYWFFPTKTFEVFPSQANNFSLDGLTKMQFYENMRFQYKDLSYKIRGCNIQRSLDMTGAFSFLENLTLLKFHPVDSGEEISVNCENKQVYHGGLWIAGEGGPMNITKSGSLNVITHGQILLLKDSECTHPNIAIHELLHVLGFDHSDNKKNIMYNVTNCEQTIGDEIINLINQIYSIESLPDLSLENVSATMEGKYLDANISIRNQGLVDSGDFNLSIYAEGELVKTLQVSKILFGYGKIISVFKVFVPQLSVNELEFVIDSSFSELDKKNNRIKLVLK